MVRQLETEEVVDQQEHNGQVGGLESLTELVSLWRQGSEKYSPEFLAATICADLGRRRRLAQAETQKDHLTRAEAEKQIREAQELLRRDPRLAECALADVYAEGLVEAIQDFVDARVSRRLTDEELADEGLRLLFDYDSLHLILAVLSQVPLSATARIQLRRERQALRQAADLTLRNPLAFFAASPMVNGYCLAWNVEEDSVLSQVARLGSREAKMLWEELNRAPDPVPKATPECPDENQIALAFEGLLSSSEQEAFDRHLKSCKHCCGLLDLLTAAFARLPAELPAAPQNALPQELRRPGIREVLLERLRQAYERVRVFFVSPLLPQSTLVRGMAASAPPLRFDEILQREVLIESPDVQAVVFLGGSALYLSILVDRLKTVQSLLITDMQTQSAWREEKRTEEGGEIRLHLGPAAALCGRQLEISFRVGKRLYRTRVHIRDQVEGQA